MMTIKMGITTTADMRAGEIEAFMAGMTIRGSRPTDGAAFTITLNPDKTTLYELAGAGNRPPATRKIIGKWWTQDFKFCMQMPAFNFGQPACPVITKEGQKLTATRPRNGAVVPLAFSK